MIEDEYISLEARVSGFLSALNDSSDIKSRTLRLHDGDRTACLVYIDEIVDTSSIQEHIIDPLLNKTVPGDNDLFIPVLMHSILEVTNLEIVEDAEKALSKLIEGYTVLFFDGEDTIIAADTVKFKERSLTTPKGQRTTEGPDLGFSESRSVNVALIRKYIKNPSLHIETDSYGKETATTVSLVYLENLVDKEILDDIKQKLEQMSYDSIIGSNYISEYLTKESKTIFPLVLNSDRPDVAAAEVLEGRVCILVDGTPYSLIAPAVFIQFFQSADDYYVNSHASKLIRPMRFILFWLSLYIPALYVAFTTFHKGLLPVNLLVGFLAQRETVPFPTVFEVLLVLILTDAIYEGSSRLPQGVVVTISLFGAIVFGQSSVEAQLVQPITLVIISTSFILSSIIPIAILSYATRIIKSSLILIAALLGLYGLALFTLLLLVHLCYLRSFKVPYLAPVSPTTWKDLKKDVFFRNPVPDINKSLPQFHKEEPMKENPKKGEDS
ncbi:spore germination protein [Rossellomorea aquimaris]|uniref:spore germination protein n=1 Tax=Rossellomorea aquimaris TaxID=189382 RepID=UPI001CD7DE13|nr:spore germination protein [Rossellomorea aquimaris]MCA1054417.1 spore germination protein [Rossellomorea aquimaris]